MTPGQAAALIETAVPGELFQGHSYRELAALVHPDRHGGDPRMAAAFARLGQLRDRQEGRGAAALLARGDIADFFPAPAPGQALKIPRDPADSDLIAREAAALRLLRRECPEQARPFLPELAASGRQRDPGTGAVRTVSTLGWAAGFVSLADVAAARPGGIGGRDAAWMWRRLLTVLGYAHRAGAVHGAVLPPHVLIHPELHGLILIDWCYSVTGGAGIVPAIVTAYRDCYPAEVAGAASRPVHRHRDGRGLHDDADGRQRAPPAGHVRARLPAPPPRPAAARRLETARRAR